LHDEDEDEDEDAAEEERGQISKGNKDNNMRSGPLWIYGELQCNFRNTEAQGSRLEDEIE